MKAGGWLLTAAALSLGIFVSAVAQENQPGARARLTVSIDAQRTAPPISRYLYGGFIEHIATLIYRSLWSEMIDDRKFYFPISSNNEQPGDASGRRGRMPLRKWRPIGPNDAVVMDKDQPFVGDQSPKIRLESASPHGIRQSGLTLVKDKRYTGRVYLRGDSDTQVKLSLLWGSSDNDRQTLSIPTLSSTYKKFPLTFVAKGDTSEGALEIAATGKGSLHIGAVSLMPADNVEGFRPDTIALLAQLHAGMWRLPGGNFLSDWDWHDSVGDIDRRPPMFDHAWNAMQTNDVGMDEFMTLCKLIGVDPYITVNAGFGDAHSAAEELEYVNGSAKTRFGEMRAHNGHPEPYHVKFWDIGNEPYGKWQLGHTDLKYYVLKHNEFAKAMRAVDPSITLLASGAMPDEMTVEGQSRAMHLDPQAQFGSDADWTGGLLAHSWGNFDGLTEHWYSRVGKRFDYEHAKTLTADAPNEAGYVPAEETLLEWVRHPSNRVAKKAEEWHEYEQRFPAMIDKKIFLSIDEYAYSGALPTLKSALAYSMVLNEMFRHTGFMTMAALTMGISTIDYNNTGSVLNTTGLLYKMYRDQFGTVPVAVSGNSPQPAPRYPPYGDQPKTNAGSPTYPLDVVAALTQDHKFLTVAIVNAKESQQSFDLSVTGARLAGPPKTYRLTGSGGDASNHVGQQQQVELEDVPASNAQGTISVPPISASILRFPLSF